MGILGIIRTIFGSWCSISSNGRTYTCPIEEDNNGNLFFKFKKEWHSVDDYSSEWTSFSDYRK